MDILTRGGVAFEFGNPRPELVSPTDVAHALSVIPRFDGINGCAYSVAQHSLAVSTYLERCGESVEMQLGGLVHEAYFGDIASQLTQLLKAGRLETPIQEVVADALGVPVAWSRALAVTQARLMALAIEREALMAEGERPGQTVVSAAWKALMPAPAPRCPGLVQAQFRDRYECLTSYLQLVEVFGEVADYPALSGEPLPCGL